jgi:chemotaxis family two-component system response regulator Rcp1
MRPVSRILLAEDNPGDVFLVEEALRRYSVPHILTIAADGEAAWDCIEAAETPGDPGFDMFLLDLNLPARPGFELLERIRSSRKNIARAPVVIITSSNAQRDRAAAERRGADYFFCKPSHLAEFLELGSVVREILAQDRFSESSESQSPGQKGKTHESTLYRRH